MKPPLPTRLEWDLVDKELLANIEEAFKHSQEIINVRFEIVDNFYLTNK
jgi:hypothetical protein